MASNKESKHVEDVNSPDSNSDTPRPKKTEAPTENTSNAKWGYDLYPERKGGRFDPSFSEMLMGKGAENRERLKCEMRVWKMAKTNPLVKIMMAALKSSGCPFDLERHVACELCDATVTGGYDIESNQIVICQNMCVMDGLVAGVLTHEMIHMFDHCRHKLDFKNVEHLACTEIRAANLTHCSFISAVSQGDASPLRIAQKHQDCVKTKAAYSVEAVRHIGIAEARRVVEKVFPQCYADLEPIGRRVRANSLDATMAFNEKHHYGY